MSKNEDQSSSQQPPEEEGRWREKRPAKCRERLREDGEPYGKSTCEICGSVIHRAKCPYEE